MARSVTGGKRTAFVLGSAALTAAGGVGAAPLQVAMTEVPSVAPAPTAGASNKVTLRQLHAAMKRLNARLREYPGDYEASLLKGLIYFKTGRFNRAMKELTGLVHRVPKYRLAHLVLGDLLLARTHAVTDIGSGPLIARMPPDKDHAVRQLCAEAEARLQAYLDTLPDDRVPRALLQLGPDVPTALVVDKSQHRLYVYRRRGGGKAPQLVTNFYVSTGKRTGNKEHGGDLRTPEGIYFITRYIPPSKLPAEYGVGAFPTNYPNALDRHLGKTGDGIWLHGTDAIYYARPPLASEGCVVLPNIDLKRVEPFLHPGVTPIVITSKVDWLSRARWEGIREQLHAAVMRWRNAWQSGDLTRYLDQYARQFWAPGFPDLARWKRYKRKVAAGKTFQKIKVSDLSLFYYPDAASHGHPIAVADFHQRYRSNNFDDTMNKRLYLVKDKKGWRVLYEGPQ